jgi:hypothetical protein
LTSVVLKAIFFFSSSMYVLDSFVKNQIAELHGFLSGFSTLLHCSFPLFLCQYHAIFIPVALWCSLKSDIVISPSLALFAQDCFGYSMTFVFQYDL